MIHVFNHALDRHLAPLGLSPQTKQVVNAQRANLAAVNLPPEIPAVTSAQITRAIDESFIAGFRTVMFIGAGLAAASAFISLVLIQGKTRRTKT